MANRYWVGGSGTWNTTSTTNWSATSGGSGGASVPTAADSVYFDQASTYTVTMTGALLCLDFNVTAGTVTFATGTGPTLAVSGSMSLISGTVWNSTGTVTFNATTAKTITSGGVTLDCPVTFSGVGGTWQLQDAMTVGSTRTTTLTSGTLDLNGKTLTTGLFSSNNSNARTLAFGVGNITVIGAGGTLWNTSTPTNFTVTGTPIVNISYSGATATTVATGGLNEANAISFNFTTGTYALTFPGSGGYNVKSVDFTGFAGSWPGPGADCIVYGNFTISTGMSITGSNFTVNFRATSGTKTITTNGKTLDFPVTFNGIGGTWQLQDNCTVGSTRTTTLSNGTLDLNNKVLSSGSFASTNNNARTIAFGVSGTGKITAVSASATAIDISVGTNLTTTGTVILEVTNATASGLSLGTTAGYWTEANALPVTIGTSSGSAGIYVTNTVTLTLAGVYGSVTFTGFTGTLAASTRTIYGNLIIATGMTISGTALVTTFGSTSGTKTITTNGKTLELAFTFNGVGGTWQLQDNCTLGTSRTVTLTNGTLDLNSKTLSSGTFSSSNSNTRTIAFGTGKITVTGSSATAIDISVGTNLTTTGTVIFEVTNGVNNGLSLGSTTAGYWTEANALPLTIGTSSGTAGIYLTSATTMTLAGVYGNMTFTGATGTLANSTRTIYGNLVVASGMTLTSGTGGTIFGATSGTKTITTNGKTLDFPVVFNGVGGTWQLQDNCTVGTTRTTTLTNGTLNLNNRTLSTGSFASNNANTRTIAFGTGKITATDNSSTAINISDGTNLTITGTVILEVTNATASGLSLGTTPGYWTEAKALPVTIGTSSGSAGIYITNTVTTTLAGVYGNMTFTGFTGTLANSTRTIYGNLLVATGMALTAGANITTFGATSGTKTITTNAKTLDFPITFDGVGGTWQLQDATTIGSSRILTLTNGTLDTNGLAVSAGFFSSSNSNTRTLIMTNNTLTLTATPSHTVWNTATSTGFTFTKGTGTVTCSGATPTVSTGGVSFYNLSFTTSGTAITTTGNISVTGTLTLTGAATMSVVGDWNVSTFISATSTVTFQSASSNLTPNGQSFYSLTVNASGFTVALQGALTCTNALTLTAGTLDLGSYTCAASTFSSNNSSTRTIAFGTGNIVLNGTGIVWTTATVTNLTVTGTPVVNVSNNTATATTVNSGALSEANSISFNFTTGTYTLTFLATSAYTARNVDFTGFAGTWAATSTGTIYGNLTLSTGMTLTASASAMTFGATSGTKTITTNSKTVDFPITFNGVGGTWQLQDAMSVGSTRTTTLTNGTLNINNQVLSTGLFATSNSNARTIAFGNSGTGKITVVGNSATALDASIATSLSLTGTPIFEITNVTASGVSIGTTAGSWSEANANSIPVTIGTSTGSAGIYITNTATLTLAGAFGNVDFTNFTGTLANSARTIYGNLTVASGMTLTAGANATTFGSTSGTENITSNGKTLDFPITFNGVGGTWQLQDALTVGTTRTTTLTNGTLDLNSKTLSTGLFASNNSNTRTIAFGTGNITVVGAGGTLWTSATATNLTITGTATVNVSYSGALATTISPGSPLEDNAIDFNFTAGTYTLTITSGSYVGNLDFTGYSGNWDYSINATTNFWRGVKLSAGMTIGFIGNTWTFRATRGVHDFDTAAPGIGFGNTIQLNFNGVGGTWKFQGDVSAISTSNPFTITNGTIDLNGYTLSVQEFLVASGTKNITFNGGTIRMSSTTAPWTFNSGAATNFTTTRGTGDGRLLFTGTSSAKTFPGSSIVYNCTLANQGAELVITGNNTFYNLAAPSGACTFRFTAGTTTTFIALNVSGASGALITLTSTSATPHILSQATGMVLCEYMNIISSTATGGAAFYAGDLSTRSGTVSGWKFMSPYKFLAFCS